MIQTEASAATHRLCRLNPTIRGARKWETISFLHIGDHNSAKEDGHTIAMRVVALGLATEREIARAKVKLFRYDHAAEVAEAEAAAIRQAALAAAEIA